MAALTSLAGNRKATERWCSKCQTWHKTFRHLDGAEICPLDYKAMAEKL
jgi:hypothetical protein